MIQDSGWWFLFFWSFLAMLTLLEWLLHQNPSIPPLRRKRWPSNFALGLVNGLITALLPVTLIGLASWASHENWGLLNQLSLPAAVTVIATVLLRSLGQYGQHRLMHVVPWLWRIHRVHHSDHGCDISTALRFHPLEFMVVLVLIGGLIPLLGLNPIGLVIYEVFEAIFGLTTHARLQYPHKWERIQRLVFNTPVLHRIHHSVYREEFERNFSSMFTLWDRMFGTFLPESRIPLSARRFGCQGIDFEPASSFDSLIDMPFRR